MYRLFIKRYRKILISIFFVMLTAVSVETFLGDSDTLSDKNLFWEHLDIIRQQDENVSGISIFGGEDSYQVKKVHRIAETYEKLEDTRLSDEFDVRHSFFISDRVFYLLAICLIFFGVYLFVYDKDKEYDALFSTMKYGRREYIQRKLGFLVTQMISIFLLISLFKLCWNFLNIGSGFGVPLQSVKKYVYAWLHIDIGGYFVLQMFWRSFWIVLLSVGIAFICYFMQKVWKATMVMVLFGLFFLLIDMNEKTQMFGLLFQMSGKYFEKLYFVSLFGIPVNRWLAAVCVVIIIGIIMECFLWKYGNTLWHTTKRNAKCRQGRAGKGKSLLLYEAKKIFLFNGYIAIVILAILFQTFHYRAVEHNITVDEGYYQQYMKYLEGKYTPEKENYLKREKEKFVTMEKEVQQLATKMQEEGLTATEQVALHQKEDELRKKYGCEKAMERMQYVKQTEGAVLFDDLSLWYFLENNSFHRKIDFFVSAVMMIILGFLLYYEEKVYDIEIFIATMPQYNRSKRCKKIFIAIVSVMMTGIAIIPRMIKYNVNVLSLSDTPMCSVPYLPTWKADMIWVFVCMAVIYTIIYYLLGTACWGVWRKLTIKK